MHQSPLDVFPDEMMGEAMRRYTYRSLHFAKAAAVAFRASNPIFGLDKKPRLTPVHKHSLSIGCVLLEAHSDFSPLATARYIATGLSLSSQLHSASKQPLSAAAYGS